MKKVFIVLLALTLAAAAGCKSPSPEAAAPTRIPINELDVTLKPVMPGDDGLENPLLTGSAADPLCGPVFTEVFRMSGGAEAGAYWRVVTDYDELRALAGSGVSSVKTVNEDSFTCNFAVAVVVTVNTGGYTFEVERARNDGRTVTVELRVAPPSQGEFATQAFETHCVLVGFDRSDFYDDLVYNITVNGQPAEGGRV